MRIGLVRRVALLEALDPSQSWRHSDGLAALLAAAQADEGHNAGAPVDLDDDPVVPLQGLARLLWEARRATQGEP
jgi:hypothetical protein